MSEVLFRALLDERATAKLLGVSVGTLQVWRCTKRVPLPYVKIDKKSVRYRPEAIDAYLASRTVKPVEPRTFAPQRAKRKANREALKLASTAVKAGEPRRKTWRRKHSR